MYQVDHLVILFSCLAYVELASALPTYLVASKPIKQEASRTVMLSPMCECSLLQVLHLSEAKAYL